MVYIMKKQYNSPRIYFENIGLNVAIAGCDINLVPGDDFIIDLGDGWTLFLNYNVCTDSPPPDSSLEDLEMQYKVCKHVSIVQEAGNVISAVVS